MGVNVWNAGSVVSGRYISDREPCLFVSSLDERESTSNEVGGRKPGGNFLEKSPFPGVKFR